MYKNNFIYVIFKYSGSIDFIFYDYIKSTNSISEFVFVIGIYFIFTIVYFAFNA